MQKFLKLTTGDYLVAHGFDEQNREILEEVTVEKSVTKLVAFDRIQSISERYVLVTSHGGRMMYWEYEENFEELIGLLRSHGLLIN
ncbi:MAG: hypothetical protein LH606_16920 [Cytophagaceae bacterium]|nr:hypothetical protein [Cytophagaceae bacterium]